MKELHCHLRNFNPLAPARFVFLQESPKYSNANKVKVPQAKKKDEQKTSTNKKNKPKSSAKHPNAKRIGELRAAIKQAQAEIPEDILSTRLEPGQTEEDAYQQYPGGEKLKLDSYRAELRKRVSKIMYEQDLKASPTEQHEIKERQVNSYYEYKIGKEKGFVEAPHGTAPSEELKKWCKENGVASHETNTAEITKETESWMVFKRPRLYTDVNSLPKGMESSLRSEGAVYTTKDNLNALVAQRDLTKQFLKEQGCLGPDDQAKNPYLGIYLHGKTDDRGSDIEIADKVVDGKGLMNPLLAFWIQAKIQEKLEKNGIKNKAGETPSVNVVTYAGAYSGSQALRALRNGDGTFDFKGLGENFQALQLEVGAHLRKTHQTELSQMLQELLKDFNQEFKTPEDLNSLEKDYRRAYDTKLEKEKQDFFLKEYVKFDDEDTGISEQYIGLSKAVLEVLEIHVGDKVTVSGHELEVIALPPAIAKLGKRFLLNKQYEEEIGEKIVIEVEGKTNTQKDQPTEQAPAAPPETNAHTTSHHEEKKEESAWTTIKKSAKFLWGFVKEKLGLSGGKHGGH